MFDRRNCATAAKVPPVKSGRSKTWNVTRVCGATVLIALLEILVIRDLEVWVDLALGAWLIASPNTIGFASVAGLRWSALVGGGVTLMMAVLSLMLPEQSTRH